MRLHSRYKAKAPSRAAAARGPPSAAASLTLTAAEPPPQAQSSKKGGPRKAEDSDSDPDAPVAQQLLSFVMDDPDFESEASDTPRIAKVKTPSPPGLLPWSSNRLCLPRMHFQSGMSCSPTCLMTRCS